ncbi:hypothetical protein [Actinomadura rubrisoli]|uniref:Uncharacterized protein n=1 Tax=Actinomadura rubrisoli TaxID=2530368 RepID=A0A4R5BJ93_9ACTN|nr:hypothetical protein [Actinomadura rubrisoli]TDD85030.1 hypothetical protein E1298_19155 [Actinomadura rubrisoli]
MSASLIVGNTRALHEAFGRVFGCRTLDDGVSAIDSGGPAHRRAIVADPARSTAELTAILNDFFGRDVAWVLEDPFGRFDGEAAGMRKVDETVHFVREPGPREDPDPGVDLRPASGPADLADAERIIATAFERPDLEASPTGALYPPRLLDEPGVSVLLAYENDEPTATVASFHDGSSVGLYWGGTLRTRRRGGLCGNLMKALVKEHPDVPALGSAGRMSQSLFRIAEYQELGRSNWWSPV